MLAAVVIVALSYIVPVAAMWMTGLSSSAWETGSWADIAGMVGGPAARRPGPGRHDQRLWHVQRPGDELFAPASRHGPGRHAAEGLRQAASPLAGALGDYSGLCHGMGDVPGAGFERLIIIDILLYGASLSLEFVALVVLRIREPELPRPFRVPGGMFGPWRSVSLHAAAGLLGRSEPKRARVGNQCLGFRAAAHCSRSRRLFPECNPQALRVEHSARQACTVARKVTDCHGFSRIYREGPC